MWLHWLAVVVLLFIYWPAAVALVLVGWVIRSTVKAFGKAMLQPARKR